MVLPQVCRRRVKVGHDAKEGNSERFGEATMPRAVTIYNIGDGDDKDARQSGLSGGMTGGAYSSDAKIGDREQGESEWQRYVKDTREAAVAIYNIGDGRRGESERQKYETSSAITETVASRRPLEEPVEYEGSGRRYI
ncbi:hypothetical protein PILCRDRAFT_86127 [Piloderma croceum F 1598]|uniref:Uncharacterized protein n=1 Tax=Piloderma croceum (strain F 1598) TaxID=765440 RepID=A0A0C3G589_PILCF|nr:hypothetical protein PILCRDRAFT_86127 [Piloderma croceum F 1598]